MCLNQKAWTSSICRARFPKQVIASFVWSKEERFAAHWRQIWVTRVKPPKTLASATKHFRSDLSGTLSEAGHRVLRLVERRKIRGALEANLGNKSKTAEDLGISYKTLLNKIKEYAL